MGRYIRFGGKLLFIFSIAYIFYISLFPVMAKLIDTKLGTGEFHYTISISIRDFTGGVKASIFGAKEGFDTFIDTAGKGREVNIEE